MKDEKSDTVKMMPWRYRIVCANRRVFINTQYAESLEKADEQVQRFIQRDCWFGEWPLFCCTFLDNRDSGN